MAGRLLVVTGQPGGRKQVKPVPIVHDAPTTMIRYSMHQTFVKYRPRTPISILFIDSGPSVQESLGVNVRKIIEIPILSVKNQAFQSSPSRERKIKMQVKMVGCQTWITCCSGRHDRPSTASSHSSRRTSHRDSSSRCSLASRR